MPFVDFAEVKASHPIETLIDRLDLTMKERGGQYRGPCPACGTGGDRALVVTPAKNAFFCFGAKTGGDVISLAAHIRGTSMKDAAHWIAGVDPSPSGEGDRSGTVPNENRKGKGERRLLEPLTYLDPAHPQLKEIGISRETLQHFGAGYAPKGILRGRLAIPIHDPDGTLVAYTGAAVEDGQEPALTFPKDFDPAGYLFNAHRIGEGNTEDAPALTLCRDPLTAMTAWENGIDPIVATLTEDIGPDHLRTLATLMDETGIPSLDPF